MLNDLPCNTLHFFPFILLIFPPFSSCQTFTVSLSICRIVSSPVSTLSTKWLWLHQSASHCSYLFGPGLIFPGSTELSVYVCVSASPSLSVPLIHFDLDALPSPICSQVGVYFCSCLCVCVWECVLYSIGLHKNLVMV